jgi:carbamate kinase
VLGAETEGEIGYAIERSLRNYLPPGKEVATLLTCVLVDKRDIEFCEPSKFIGPLYASEIDSNRSVHAGWTMKQDGKGWRRVVPSPKPIKILEIKAIEALVKKHFVVVCTGGGGIPVAQVPQDGGEVALEGVEAVVDKDFTSAMLANELDADALVFLTDVDHVYHRFGTEHQQPIRHMHSSDIEFDSYPKGSMRPKLEAAAAFVENNKKGNRFACIGNLANIMGVVRKSAGTVVTS